MMDPGNPPARRTSNRRRAMSRARHTPECEKIWVEFIRRHPLCRFHLDVLRAKIRERFPLDQTFTVYADTPPEEVIRLLKGTDCEDLLYLVVPTKNPHHPYLTKASEYCTPEVIAKCTPTCTRCHRAIHRGKVLCPVCGENYAPWDADPKMCRPCFDKAHPEVVIAREKHARDFKERQKKLQREAKEKAKWRWLREEIRSYLQMQINTGRFQTRHILQDVETALEFISREKSPLKIIRTKVLHGYVDRWLVEEI